MHLRDADLLRDLGLRQALEEAQVKDRALTLVEDAEAGRQDRAVLGDFVLILLGAKGLERIEIAVLVLARTRRKRQRAVRPAALERLEHFSFRDFRGLRQLGDRRRAAQLDGQLLEQARELEIQLL